MSGFTRTIVPVVVGMGVALAFAQQQVPGSDEALRASIDEAREEMGLEAGAVQIDIGSETLFSTAFGQDSPGKKREADLGTTFEAGGFAHAWLTTLVLAQRERGKLSLDQEVGKLLPELVGEACPVHVANLLNHTSGLADYTDFVAEEERRGSSYAVLLATLKEQPLLTEPGECVTETPTDTLLLAALVEKLTGMSAAEAIQVGIFDKLGMRDSGYVNGGEPKDERTSGSAEARAIEATGDAAEPALWFDGLRSSTRDLVTFQRGLVDLELIGSGDLEAMCSETRLLDGSSVHSGMGLRCTAVGGSEAMLLGDQRAALAYFPEHDLIVAAAGRGEAPRLDRLALRLVASVTEVPAPELVDLYLNEVEMRPYLGSYSIGCNILLIKPGVGHIVLDRADEGEDILLYQGGQRFVAERDTELVLTFELEGPKASWFTLDDHGRVSIATRFDE